MLPVEDDVEDRDMYTELLTNAVMGYAAFAAGPGRAGCDAVLPTPCSQDDLETAVRGLIEDRARHDAS
ncbi:MAG: hypothetical protein ABI818_03135 [Acidobacteriota bacterium]